MQYLVISKDDTLQSIARIVGSQNIDLILAENSLTRSPKIGKQWYDKCAEIIRNTPNDITGSRKATLLNSLTGSDEAFEKACLMDENEWKVFSAVQSFPDTLRIPESIKLPYSTKVIGDGEVAKAALGVTGRVRSSKAKAANVQTPEPVDPVTYRAIMKGLKISSNIDPVVFNEVNTSPAVTLSATKKPTGSSPQYSFNLPWGKIQLYSSLLSQVMDFPAYPEEVETARNANYTAMPDIIYQYEPWICYQDSGPREQSLTFHMHRDMWSGNHLDGRANELIRFCEANTFPRYSGSTVLSPTVRLYIDGSLFISGVMTGTRVNWKGPIGQDNWYLEFELTLMFQEIAEQPLNIDTVSQLGIIGG